jgi:hypothetical protein
LLSEMDVPFAHGKSTILRQNILVDNSNLYKWRTRILIQTRTIRTHLVWKIRAAQLGRMVDPMHYWVRISWWSHFHITHSKRRPRGT